MSIISNKLQSFDYYVNKLPLYLQNSYGFIEHFRIWYETLVASVVKTSDEILNLINIFDEHYLDYIESLKHHDKAFLLSREEFTKLNVVHQNEPTDYAKCQGVYTYNNTSSWWLRSPTQEINSQVASEKSQINNGDAGDVNTSIGVVPAIRVDSTNLTIINNKCSLGQYPQTKISDSGIINALNSLVSNPQINLSDWISFRYYINGKQQDYMWYTDVEYSGYKYRGIFFTSYRPISSMDVSAGEQRNNGYLTNNIYWFKFEDISWLVLSNVNNEAFLLSEKILDSQPFQNTVSLQAGIYYNNNLGEVRAIYANNYYESTIRQWLISFVDNSFTSSQKDIIFYTFIDCSLKSIYDYNTQNLPDNPYAIYTVDYDHTQMLDFLAVLFGQSRKPKIGNNYLTLTDEELLILIKVQILRNYFMGTKEELFELYYNKLKLNMLYVSKPNANCYIYLVYTFNDEYSQNIWDMFNAGMLTVESIGIAYTYSALDLTNYGQWDNSQWGTAKWTI